MAVCVRMLHVASVALPHNLVLSASVLKAFSALAEGWSLAHCVSLCSFYNTALASSVAISVVVGH